MALTLVKLCDIHMKTKDERVTADSTYVFYLEGTKPLAIDVCDACFGSTPLRTFAAYVESEGRDLETGVPAPTKGESLQCPYGCKPPRGAEGFVSMQGLRMHMTLMMNKGRHPDWEGWKAQTPS
jgi:hypothetical protein